MNPSKPAGLILVSALVFGVAMPVASQQSSPPPAPSMSSPPQPPPRPETQTTKSIAVNVPVYKPPLRGAPGGRVGGGSRGTPRDLFVLSALVPDHSGLTTQEQPSLYWYISNPTSFRVELTISDTHGTRPLLETSLPSPVAAGIHTIRLADYGVRLTPGVQYRWFVAVVPDAARRSRDILAGGTIERVDAPETLRTRLAQARPEELPFLYADAGIWYDALAAIAELIERTPANPELRQQRAALLSEVGLPPVDADSERTPTR